MCCPQPGMDKWDGEQQEAEKLKAGWPAFLTDLRIIDDNGKELPHNGEASGTLQARGPHTVQTFYKASLCLKCSSQTDQRAFDAYDAASTCMHAMNCLPTSMSAPAACIW